MSRSERRQPANGFTIVETMIVLAIAGLMLLLVFEAIPTLVRNSRNNQRKQDANAILEAVSHYELNNSGDMPSCSSYANCTTGPTELLKYTQLSYYSSVSDIEVEALDNGNTFTALPTTSITNIEEVRVFNGAKCSSNGAGNTATDAGAGFNDVVALYAIETGGSGSASQCEEL